MYTEYSNGNTSPAASLAILLLFFVCCFVTPDCPGTYDVTEGGLELR